MEQLPINVCFETLLHVYFLLILYAVISNYLLTVLVALHFQCFQNFDFMNMKSVCFSKKIDLDQ